MLFAAIVLAAAGFTFSAYTTPKAELTEGWFRLIDPAHPNNASSYEYVGETAPCEGDEDLCAIYGEKNPSNDEPMPQSVSDASSDSQNFTVPSPLVAYEN